MSLVLPVGSEVVLARDRIDAALVNIARQLEQRFDGQALTLMTVMNGGMLTAANLALRLNLPLVLDYLHVSRYHHEQGGEILTWHAHPLSPIEGETILVVDDIFDQGYTLQAIVKALYDNGAAEVVTMTLVEKMHGQVMVPLRPDYIGLQVPDRYVFGYGMDYRGGLRHLPDIWALPEV